MARNRFQTLATRDHFVRPFFPPQVHPHRDEVAGLVIDEEESNVAKLQHQTSRKQREIHRDMLRLS
jgi:hypothetical protein